jgi:hypothetical protein
MWMSLRKRTRRQLAPPKRARALKPEAFDRLERREVLATAMTNPLNIPAGLFSVHPTVNRLAATNPLNIPAGLFSVHPTVNRALPGASPLAGFHQAPLARALFGTVGGTRTSISLSTGATARGINFNVPNAGRGLTSPSAFGQLTNTQNTGFGMPPITAVGSTGGGFFNSFGTVITSGSTVNTSVGPGRRWAR